MQILFIFGNFKSLFNKYLKPQLGILFLQFLAFGEYKLGVAFCPSLTAFFSSSKTRDMY